MMKLDRVSGLSITAFSILCGSVSLIYPFGRDQGSYGYAAFVLLDGGMPYRDVYAYKPPMNILLHAGAMGLFGVNTWAIRLLDIAWTAATGLVVASIALELWKRRDAALVAGLAIPFFYYQIDYWTIAQTDGWMTLPCSCAVWAVLRGGRVLQDAPRRAVVWWIAAGACAAVAVLFKYTAGLIGLPMLLALGWIAATYRGKAWLGVPAMLIGGVLMLATCWAWLAGGGAWASFVEIQLGLTEYVGQRADLSEIPRTMRWLFTLERTKTDLAPLVWAPFLGVLPALIALRPKTRADWVGVALVGSWWLTAFGNVLVQGKFYDYHYLPLLAPSALIAGLGLSAVLRLPLRSMRRRSLRVAFAVALAAVAMAATPIRQRATDLGRVVFGGQTIEEYIASREEYALPLYDVGEVRRLAESIEEMTTPDQRVFLWGYAPTIYVRARRHTVSRFLYNFPLRTNWKNAEYKAELVRALREQPPEVFVVASGDPYYGLTGSRADSAALLDEFEELGGFVAALYEPAQTVGRYTVFKLKGREGPPDILLITVDTLRPDRLGAYGAQEAHTPAIDALARRGTTFLNAFAPMGRTTPAFASMMTGLWPHEHGSREVRDPVLHGTLITEVLRDAGYSTLGVMANPAAGRGPGLAEGFEVFSEVGDRGPDERWNAEDVTNRASALLNDVPAEKPLFLWVHYLDPHWPYEAPGSEDDPATRGCSKLKVEVPRGARESNEGGRSHEALGHCLGAYQREVAFTDAQIGRLLETLRQKKRLDNAVVLFSSDHGENFGEGGLYYTHGANVHDASLRVPLIIVGAGLPKGAERGDVVRLLDVAPTILAFASVPEGEWPSMRGVPQSPLPKADSNQEPLLAFAESGGTLVLSNHAHLLSGRPRTGYCINRGRYSLCWRESSIPALHDRDRDPGLTRDLRSAEPQLYEEMMQARDRWPPSKTRERSVSDGRFKLVERPRFEGGYSRSLFDTSRDSSESIDVQGQYPAHYERLSQALETWTAEVPGYIQEAMSEEVEAQLKALGYIE